MDANELDRGDSVLIIGAGVAGLAAAVACAKAGAHAVVVERSPIVGGKLAAALVDGVEGAAGAGGDDRLCLADLEVLSGIEILTLADVEGVDGEPGSFLVSIRERARFVTDACTRCNHCPQVCPQVAANEFDANLSYRKAIYTPMQQTLPGAFVIDMEACLNLPPNYLPCQRCVEVCDDHAIDFSMPLERRQQRQVAALIVAAGFEVAGNELLQEFGYGSYPDVVTSMELQRMLQTPGPTGGFVVKPSNEEYPDRVLLVLQESAAFSAYVLEKQIARLVDQEIGEICLLLLEQQGGELDRLEATATEAGMTLRRGAWVGIREAEEGEEQAALQVSYVDLATGLASEQAFDLVVLACDVQPPAGLAELAETLGAKLTEQGYLATRVSEQEGDDRPLLCVATSREGVYAAGCATGPLGVAQSVAQAQAAATAALAWCGHGSEPATNSAELAALPPELSETEQQLRMEQLLEALILLGGDARDGQ